MTSCSSPAFVSLKLLSPAIAWPAELSAAAWRICAACAPTFSR
jgi:hypothetical protein